MQTITNCFHHCGFEKQTDGETSHLSEEEEEDGSCVGGSLLTRLSSHGVEFPDDLSFELLTTKQLLQLN